MKHIVETHLCIGGPLARQHVVRDGDLFRVTGNAGDALYRRSEIAGERQAFSVWVYEHTSPDQALEYLLHAYGNSTSAETERRWLARKVGE